MPKLLKEHWPLVAALSVLGLLVAVFYHLVLARTGGVWVYCLDDTYIHMSMAQNLVDHGVFGLTRYEFSSSSSAPLWTCLVALAYFAGVSRDLAPFILALLSGVLLLGVAYGTWRRAFRSDVRLFLWLLALLFAMPLVALIFAGMEHLLHAALSVGFAAALLRVLSEPPPARRHYAALLILGALLPVCRYEGFFLVFVSCLALLWSRRWGVALALGAASALPAGAYAAVSCAHGWYALPNSVLLRGMPRVPESLPEVFLLLGGRGLAQLFYAPHLLALLLVVGYLVWVRRERDVLRAEARPLRLVQIVFVGTLLLHVQFSAAFGFFRYEAYVVALGLWALGLALGPRGAPAPAARTARERLAHALLALVLLFPLCLRGALGLYCLPQAVKNIHEQQYQMSEFLRRYYPRARVAANDIGLICYRSGIHVLDLHGLADMEVARLRRARQYTPEAMSRLARARDVQISVLYPEWFEKAVPREWREAGRWLLQGNVVCGGEWVVFCAAKPDEWTRLRGALLEFAPRLPKDVRYSILEAKPGEAR